MKVEIIASVFSEKSVQKKVNNIIDYINDNNFEVLEVQYRPTFFYCSAMIVYR